MIEDNFSIGVEIDLEKSRIDENGDVIVEGIASGANEDFQGHTIDQKGWDLGYFLRKGFLKWEHSKDPRNFIGEPLEAKATKAGLYVKGRLYGGMPKTQEVVELIDGMKKSQSSRKIGMSIEGQALERDPNNPNIIKRAVLRNVALTANPVNDATWVDLVKSLSDADSLSVELDETEVLLKQVLSRGGDAEMTKSLNAEKRVRAQAPHIPEDTDLEKALGVDTPGGAVLQTQDLEQDKPKNKETDPKKRRQAIIDAFREFVQSYLQKNTLQKSLNLATREGAAGFAMGQGLEENEVEDFSSLIDNNRELLKSLAVRVAGGELSMSKVLDELQKSLAALAEATGAESDELEKSLSDDDGENQFDNIDEDLMDEDADEELDYDPSSEEADEELGGDEDGDDDEDDEDSELVKSLMSEDPEIEEAFEVTSFLRSIANQVGYRLDDVANDLQKSFSVQNQLTKSLSAMGTVVLDLGKRAEDAERRASASDELMKSLDSKLDMLLNTPVGRRSVTNPRELVTLQKSMGNEGSTRMPSHGEVVDLLIKGFQTNEVDRLDVTRFETGGFPAVSGRGKAYIQKQLDGVSR